MASVIRPGYTAYPNHEPGDETMKWADQYRKSLDKISEDATLDEVSIKETTDATRDLLLNTLILICNDTTLAKTIFKHNIAVTPWKTRSVCSTGVCVSATDAAIKIHDYFLPLVEDYGIYLRRL